MDRSPRVPATTEADWDDETRGLLDGLGRLNIFTVLAHHPALLRRWLTFGAHVLLESTLPARDRELVILRVGWRCRSPYEFAQHRLLGESAGLTDEEIRRTAEADLHGGPGAHWSERDRLLLRAADRLVADHRLDDETWAALRAELSLQQVMDLVFTVGQYVLTSMALNTFEIPLDEGIGGVDDIEGFRS